MRTYAVWVAKEDTELATNGTPTRVKEVKFVEASRASQAAERGALSMSPSNYPTFVEVRVALACRLAGYDPRTRKYSVSFRRTVRDVVLDKG